MSTPGSLIVKTEDVDVSYSITANQEHLPAVFDSQSLSHDDSLSFADSATTVTEVLRKRVCSESLTVL